MIDITLAEKLSEYRTKLHGKKALETFDKEVQTLNDISNYISKTLNFNPNDQSKKNITFTYKNKEESYVYIIDVDSIFINKVLKEGQIAIFGNKDFIINNYQKGEN